MEWSAPLTNPLGKQFKISINSSIVHNVTVSSAVDVLNTEEIVVDLPSGNLNLMFQMFGTIPDNYGILIGNITLRKIVPLDEEF